MMFDKSNKGGNVADKIIKTKVLPSGCTAIAVEVSGGSLAIEVGSGVVFITAEDIPALVTLLHDADRHFLGKE